MPVIEGIIQQCSCAAIEQIGNRLISLDPEAEKKLRDFADKTIHVHISDLDLNYYFLFPGGSLVVQPDSNRQPSASIQGKLSAFIASANSENAGDSIFKGELHFSGEINVARKFQSFAQSLNIDWQEPISKVFGDVAGETISKGIKQFGDMFGNLVANVKQDIPEYLQEEIRVTPTQFELDLFYDSIDLVRSQTDRLAARVQRLTEHD